MELNSDLDATQAGHQALMPRALQEACVDQPVFMSAAAISPRNQNSSCNV